METGNQMNAPQDQNIEVNFDALSAPEGQYDPMVHGDGGANGAEGGSQDGIPGSSEDYISGLPNLDKEMGGNQSQNNNDFNQNLDNQNQNQNQNQDPNNQQQQQQASGDYWMKPFEQIKSKYPDFQIPEGLNEENYLETLQEVLQPQLHPEVAKIQKAINEGIDFNQAITHYNSMNDVASMSDRDLLQNNLKQTFKDWDESKINEVLNKMENSGTLEIEAGKLRNSIKEQQQTALDTMSKEAQAQREADLKQIGEQRTKAINESLEFINKADNVYGLPLSQAEKAEFGEYFSKLVTPDSTGTAPMFQMLQSNETLVKVAAMLWKGDAKIRAALTEAKESGKNAVLGKLDNKPQSVQRGGNAPDPMQVDFDALSAPERLMH